MALALQLIAIPVAMVIGIVLLGMANALSVGAVIGGLLILAVIGTVVYGLVRFARHVDVDAGVDNQEMHHHPRDEDQSSGEYHQHGTEQSDGTVRDITTRPNRELPITVHPDRQSPSKGRPPAPGWGSRSAQARAVEASLKR